MPDRLPSLVLLVGFWIPPALVGWMAADARRRAVLRARGVAPHAALVAFAPLYAAAWFLLNVGRMPPYIPGATLDPTVAPPRAVAGLAVVAGALVLPGSALACALAYRRRARALEGVG